MGSAARALFAFVACNSTEQCAALEPYSTCTNNLCLCPSFEPLVEMRRCDAPDPVLPPALITALGENCTVNAQCPALAHCVAGQCRCSEGYEPAGARNCSSVARRPSPTPWLGLAVLASVFLIALLAVIYFVAVEFRSRRRGRRLWRKTSDALTTIVVSGQATADPTRSTAMAPTPSMESTVIALDADRNSTAYGGGASSSLCAGGRESTFDVSAQGVPSVTELCGLGSVADEPFVPPVLSGEQLYAKYPHLCSIPSSADVQPRSETEHGGCPPTSTAGEPPKLEGSSSASQSSTRDKSSKRRGVLSSSAGLAVPSSDTAKDAKGSS